MIKQYIVYYPAGGMQTALNILLLLGQGTKVEDLDLPPGFSVEFIEYES